MPGCVPRRWHCALAVLVLVALIASACQSAPVAAPADTTPTPRAAVAVAEPTPTVTATPPPVASQNVDPTPMPTTAPQPPPNAQEESAASVADLLVLSMLRGVPCPSDVAAAQVTCSVATLPLDVDTPVPGENAEIMVALVDNGDPNNVGPVVFLNGGPGVGTITQAKNFVGASHDVLFVDHRGTGYSTPKLNCPEIDELWEAQFSDDPDIRLTGDGPLDAAYVACGERLASQGIDFGHFNTTSAAVDIELLRQLFGYEQWSIWGISYGTRLGLTVMRDHPDGVRSAVLDSLVPFEVDFFATIPENGMRAIEALDQACDVDDCAFDHGDFLTTLTELVQELNETPVVVTATRPITGQQFPFRVDGEQLVDLVFTQLYSTRAIRALPRQIARAEFGGIEEIVASFVTRRDPGQFDLSIGLYYTTWCREEFPFYDESADDDFLGGLDPQFGPAVAGALSSDGVGTFCDAFAVEPAPTLEDEPLVSAIPTLVFAGSFDPITPPAWSQQVADALPNSFYVEMANHGHGMSTSCPVSIRLAFLIDASTAPDTTCAEETEPPDFE